MSRFCPAAMTGHIILNLVNKVVCEMMFSRWPPQLRRCRTPFANSLFGSTLPTFRHETK